MASIRNRNGRLFIDFRYHGKRCREMTMFNDNKTNRKKLNQIIERMDAEIILGSFDYQKYLPKSDKAAEMVALNNRVNACRANVPLFKDFVDLWYEEKQIEWRLSYQHHESIRL